MSMVHEKRFEYIAKFCEKRADLVPALTCPISLLMYTKLKKMIHRCYKVIFDVSENLDGQNTSCRNLML